MRFFHSFGGGIEMKGGGGPGGVDDYGDHQQHRPNEAAFLVTKQQLQEQHHQLQLQEEPPKPECYSDEVDSRSGDGAAAESLQPHAKKKRKSSSTAALTGKAASGGGSGDGASFEAARRPRGRPPGSKNRPKPPVVITRDADDDPSSPAAMRPYVMEIPAGEDVADALARFSHRRGLGLSVLAGTGLVSNVVLRPNLSFHGHFQILSISATFLPPSFAPSPPLSLPPGGGWGLSVTLAGPQGQIFGGLVAGPLTAAGTVTILAATFCNTTYHRLPVEEDVSVSVSGGGGGDAETARGLTAQAQRHQHAASSREQSQPQQPPHQPQQQRHHQQQHQRSTSPPSSSSDAPAAAAAQHYHHHRHLLHHPAAVAPASATGESCGMSIYGLHLPPDVMWAPAARSPPY